jgi:hypothetical protein
MTDDNSSTGENDSGAARTYPDYLLRQDRERGLSKADRRYLASRGETVENEGTDVNTRIRIRERIRESIVDFWLIQEYLSDYDRDLLFEPSDDDWDNWELQIGIKSAMQFFYTALDESGLADFETVLTSAIHDAKSGAYDRPISVDVNFDVEVDEQFNVRAAYDKFWRGVPLSPMEVGVLLTTGWVEESEVVERLARHARTHGTIERPISPLLGEQLAEISGDEDPIQSYQHTWAHLPENDYSDVATAPELSYFDYLEEQREFQEEDYEGVTMDDLADDELTEELAEIDPMEEDIDENGNADESGDPDATLRRLSVDLGQPITVGDNAVYEDGDRHPLDDGEKGADSPADTDDDADGSEG